jgi:hypothetical protein
MRTLYGTLTLHRRVLGWRGWCDRCRQHHHHGWASSSPDPQHRAAHCRGGGGDYYIALDGDYSQLLAKWARLNGRG